MKKIISLIIVLILISGCNEQQDLNSKQNNDGNKNNGSESNKKLICSASYEQDESTDRKVSYTFIFDNNDKVETFINSDTMILKDTVLSEYNIKQYKENCVEVDTYEGISCSFKTENNNKISTLEYQIDYQKLDSNAREFLEQDDDYLQPEKYSYYEIKKMFKNLDEDVEFICE